jgi:hypothetical protein
LGFVFFLVGWLVGFFGGGVTEAETHVYFKVLSCMCMFICDHNDETETQLCKHPDEMIDVSADNWQIGERGRKE